MDAVSRVTPSSPPVSGHVVLISNKDIGLCTPYKNWLKTHKKSQLEVEYICIVTKFLITESTGVL